MTVKEWSLLNVFTSPLQIAAASSAVFFTDVAWQGPGQSALGRLILDRDTVTKWILPFTTNSAGAVAFNDGYVFVSDASAILRLLPSRNAFVKWTLPFGLSGWPAGLAFDSQENVYFCASNNSGLWIGRLHHKTSALTIWAIPTSLATPGYNRVADVAVAPNGHVFFPVQWLLNGRQ